MKTKKAKQQIPLLSFFTGGGFLDIGFEQAGFKVVWTNEVNPIFADLYAYGMSQWRSSFDVAAPDITISTRRNIEHLFGPEIIERAFPGGKPKFFGIIGGPPCPDFSVGGKNEGGEGANGRLTKTYVQRICKLMPDFFVFENVKGLFRTKVHRDFLAGLEKKLERHGYCLDLKVLNALDLGVPQDRERLIMIGVKKEIVRKCLGRQIGVQEREWFSWPMRKKYHNAKNRFNWPDAVVDNAVPVLPEGIPVELTVYSILNPDNSSSGLKNGNDTFRAYSDKFAVIREGDTKRKSFKKLHRYRFSPTACYGHNEVHLHPWKERRLSVREAMRIQGIPDAYALPDEAPLTAKFTIVSNGVPVPLARQVAKKVFSFFKKGGIV